MDQRRHHLYISNNKKLVLDIIQVEGFFYYIFYRFLIFTLFPGTSSKAGKNLIPNVISYFIDFEHRVNIFQINKIEDTKAKSSVTSSRQEMYPLRHFCVTVFLRTDYLYDFNIFILCKNFAWWEISIKLRYMRELTT
jgi:hypothetical protein